MNLSLQEVTVNMVTITEPGVGSTLKATPKVDGEKGQT
jgi:hypothetical protein